MAIAQKIIFAILLFPLLLITIYLLPTPIYAVEEKDFATSYDVTYEVGTDGVTLVNQKITLRNLSSQYFATQFSLNIGSTEVFDISASDGGGSMEVKQELVGTFTKLTVKFNQQIAGKDKILTWNLKFKSRDFARNIGKIWEISLPKIEPDSNLENYNLNLLVPSLLGNPEAITPKPKNISNSSGHSSLNFTKDQLIKSGVLITFGRNQLFDFNLNYHLQNPGLTKTLTNVALPPDTEYQDVAYKDISPKPENVTVDQDGNYIAWYRIKRGENLNIMVRGVVKLYLHSKAKNPSLDPAVAQKYLSADKFWESNHPLIKNKLTELLGPNPHGKNLDKARLINRFVAAHLKYNSSRLSAGITERLGALTALNNPSEAVCMEFTDLFIALSRAAGIPARELNGFSFTSNPNIRPLSLQKDILHSWPEVWDNEKGWVMIDPTWEATTGGVDYFNNFDLNHFAFVIKGVSSEKPIPAGSYKTGQDSKDVDVRFSEKDFDIKPEVKIEIIQPDSIVAGFPNKIKVKITNIGNSFQQSSPLSLAAGELLIFKDSNLNSGPIPAFGFAEFEFDTKTKSIFDNFEDVLEVSYAGQKIRKPVNVEPFILFRNFPLGLILIGALIGLIYFGLLGGFLYRKRFIKAAAKKAKSKK